MPFVYFTAPDASGPGGTTIQLVTTPKVNPDNTPVSVVVTAYNSMGNVVTLSSPQSDRTGPFELEISYALPDARTGSTQISSIDMGSNALTVQDSSKLSVGMTVEGAGIMNPTTITGIVDPTHVTLSTGATANVANSILSFYDTGIYDHFFGMYLPAGAPWSLTKNNVSVTGSTTLGSSTITVQDASKLTKGMIVTGPGINANTIVTGINLGTNTVTLSQAATATGAGVGLSFTDNSVIFSANLTSKNYFSVATPSRRSDGNVQYGV